MAQGRDDVGAPARVVEAVPRPTGDDLDLVRDVVARMKEAGLNDVPVVVGGIIPPADASALKSAGVAEVYTPKDFELNRIMSDLVRIVEGSAAAKPADAAE